MRVSSLQEPGIVILVNDSLESLICQTKLASDKDGVRCEDLVRWKPNLVSNELDIPVIRHAAMTWAKNLLDNILGAAAWPE